MSGGADRGNDSSQISGGPAAASFYDCSEFSLVPKGKEAKRESKLQA